MSAVHVTHVSLARDYRGAQRQLELLVRGIASHGIPQRAVVGSRRLAEALGDVPGLEVRRADGTPFAALAIPGACRVVHAHEVAAAPAALFRQQTGGPPYVVTQRLAPSQRAPRLVRRACRRAARLVAVSQYVVEAIRAEDPSLSPVLIPSGVAQMPSDPFKVERLRRRYEGKFLVGNVAPLDDRLRGQRVLIEAARQIQTSHPHVHFLLLGDGPDAQALREAAAGLTNLEFAGWVDDVGNYLGALDLFAYPSREEALGSALLEAMASGVPVLASEVGGVPELVSPQTGRLVASGDVGAFVSALVALAEDAALREEMGEAARKQADRFTAERMVNSYLRLYGALGYTAPTAQAPLP